jgi:hypothetical protein
LTPARPLVVVTPVIGIGVTGNWLRGIWPSYVIEPADVTIPELVTDTGVMVVPEARVVPEVKPIGKVAVGIMVVLAFQPPRPGQ